MKDHLFGSKTLNPMIGCCWLMLLLMLQALGQSSGLPYPATDGLGRSLPTHAEVGDVRAGKTVAMFYWTWHHAHAFNKPYIVSEMLKDDPGMLTDFNHPGWAKYAQGNYFWGEPIYDFYRSSDQWVMRKQLELFGDAGVDVLFYDATNGSLTWKEGYDAMGQAMAQARADGATVPQFAFMLNFGPFIDTARSLNQLYNDIYGNGKYQESWFRWNGKPVIMAYPESLDQIGSSPGSASLRFTATKPFTGISANCPSWSNNDGDLALSIYAWKGDVISSCIGPAPLATKTFVNYVDNASLQLEFGELPPGDYVWRLDAARETVGVWKFLQSTPGTESFRDGTRQSASFGSYDSLIRYAGNGGYTSLTTGGTREAVPIAEGITDARKNEIRNFFTFRPGQPSYEGGPKRNDQWAWLENYPQNGYVQKSPGKYELATVGVAQNWSEQTRGLAAMNASLVHGRSYTRQNGHSLVAPGSNVWGYNFQEQWNRALQIDPDIVFVTGWNEWIMGRYKDWQGTPNAFPDQYNPEYSRDIEPSKGELKDHYYYQLVSNIRRFKGMKAPEALSSHPKPTAPAWARPFATTRVISLGQAVPPP